MMNLAKLFFNEFGQVLFDAYDQVLLLNLTMFNCQKPKTLQPTFANLLYNF